MWSLFCAFFFFFFITSFSVVLQLWGQKEDGSFCNACEIDKLPIVVEVGQEQLFCT